MFEAYRRVLSEREKKTQKCWLRLVCTEVFWGEVSYHSFTAITLCSCCRLRWLLCRTHACFTCVCNLSETSLDILNRIDLVWKCPRDFSWLEWKHCVMIQHFEHTMEVSTQTPVYIQTSLIWLGLWVPPVLVDCCEYNRWESVFLCPVLSCLYICLYCRDVFIQKPNNSSFTYISIIKVFL